MIAKKQTKDHHICCDLFRPEEEELVLFSPALFFIFGFNQAKGKNYVTEIFAQDTAFAMFKGSVSRMCRLINFIRLIKTHSHVYFSIFQ